MFTHLEAFLYKPQLFEALWASTPILVEDMTTGNIVAASPPLLALFGYTAEELIGQPVDILLPPHLRAAHREHRRGYREHPRLRTMGLPNMRLVGQRKDGREFDVVIQLSPAMLDDRGFVIAVVYQVRP
jgi:PAS domain S-box-containing protein